MSSKTKKLISVIIPSYNRFDKLLRCVESIKSQKLPANYELEIIVINDGSTDLRYKTYEATLDGVTLIHLSENTLKLLGYVSVGFVRNCGLRISRGEWITFCDDDDYWLPNKLIKQMHYKNRAVVSDAYRHKFGSINHENRYNDHYSAYYRSLFPHDFLNGFPTKIKSRILNQHNVCIFSTLMIHRSIMYEVGMFNERLPFREFYEDWDYLKRIARIEDIKYIDEPLIVYEFY